MPLVRKIRGRGATTTVVATAEVLWPPGEQISRWQNRLSNAVTRATAAAAPSNKRPRWAHYNARTLKQSFTSTTKINVARMKSTTVVGSRAGYSTFVDQGTGIFAGHSPWVAKILPPSSVGASDLHEATWRPHKSSRPQGGVIIKGQRGRFFFATGLRKGFAAAGLASIEVPEAALAGKTRGMNVTGDMLSTVLGNTPADEAFGAQLAQWRRWRERAFIDPERPRIYKSRSRGYARPRVSSTERKRLDRINSKRYRDKIRGGPPKPRQKAVVSTPKRSNKPKTNNKVKKPTKTNTTKSGAGTTAGRARFKAAMLKKYGAVENFYERGGRFYATVPYLDDQNRRQFKEVSGKAS